MKLKPLTLKQSLNKAYLREKPTRSSIELFKKNLVAFLDDINEEESEEHIKNLITKFLNDTYYNGKYQINTKGRIDLAISEDKKAVVLFEAKRPKSHDMVRVDDLNTRAMHELMLYYLRERVDHGNIDIKYLVITNAYEWFIFEAAVFDSLFYRHAGLMKEFTDWKEGRKARADVDLFYQDIAKPFLSKLKDEVAFLRFDLRDIEKYARNEDKKDDVRLIDTFKIFSPTHLLRLPFANDSNSLDKGFYTELLHIIGLEEVKDGGKKLIQRKEKPDTASLLENTIQMLSTEDRLHKLAGNGADYGEKPEDRLFNVALELCITWMNRVLFLKLLEGQLLGYQSGNRANAFLDFKTIPTFDELNKLFFQVLAVRKKDRASAVNEKFGDVPYLNSSLFEISPLEDDTLRINSLDDSLRLKIHASTVLKKENGKRREGELPLLQYLFEFLDAYDFSTEGDEEIQEENKTLINAAVLGLIFEKINGYKDGSFFTPGFITMYMCRETIRRAVVQKFVEVKGWKLETFDDLHNKIKDQKEANAIINSLKICDPAVGSGHFLVSALNEIIAIKSELRVLLDRDGHVLRDYSVEVINDELIVSTGHNEFFSYKPGQKESQRVQEALFHEKESIIENCLFGVDINPNSVKICRLRLWIELLKSAYYTAGSKYAELETLPNIDINIKQGNSLISRFALGADLSKALKSIKYSIEQYRGFVSDYKNATDKETKRGFETLINQIKKDFRTEIVKNDPKVLQLSRKSGELFNLLNQARVFEPSEKEKKDLEKKKEKLEAEITKLSSEIDEIKNNSIYKGAFEWRFEFPEVMNQAGEFVGFDCVIGNPPYIRHEEIKALKPYLESSFQTFSATADLYVYFVERGFQLLRNGHFCFIMPNKWMQTAYGHSLRKFLRANQLLMLIDFGDLQIFDGATTYPCILVAHKGEPTSTFMSYLVTSKDIEGDFSLKVCSALTPIEVDELGEESWVISSKGERELLNRIRSIATDLKTYVQGEAHFGIKTGLSEAFVVDNDTRSELLSKDVNSGKLLKPFVLGREISAYSSPATKNWLILIPKGFTVQNAAANEDPWGWFFRSYPGIAGHLDHYKVKAQQRTDMGDFWWELRACDYYEEFESPKIMYQVFQVKPCFVLSEDTLYCNNSMWIIPRNDKVLLAILNSKLGWWLISRYCTAIQNGYQLIWKYFSQVPIVKPSPEECKKIESLVDTIIGTKKLEAAADVVSIEQDLDAIIYKAYRLSAQEIKLVEDFASSRG